MLNWHILGTSGSITRVIKILTIKLVSVKAERKVGQVYKNHSMYGGVDPSIQNGLSSHHCERWSAGGRRGQIVRLILSVACVLPR